MLFVLEVVAVVVSFKLLAVVVGSVVSLWIFNRESWFGLHQST